jgi:hypothetical protein
VKFVLHTVHKEGWCIQDRTNSELQQSLHQLTLQRRSVRPNASEYAVAFGGHRWVLSFGVYVRWVRSWVGVMLAMCRGRRRWYTFCCALRRCRRAGWYRCISCGSLCICCVTRFRRAFDITTQWGPCRRPHCLSAVTVALNLRASLGFRACCLSGAERVLRQCLIQNVVHAVARKRLRSVLLYQRSRERRTDCAESKQMTIQSPICAQQTARFGTPQQ